MLINYQIGSGGWTKLFDESAGDASQKFAPSFQDRMDQAPGYGAANETRLAMGNTAGHLPLVWSSNYGTADAALAAIKTLRGTFKGVQVNLQVIAGTTTVYFNHALLMSSSHDQQGCEVLHTMTFACDDIS